MGRGGKKPRIIKGKDPYDGGKKEFLLCSKDRDEVPSSHQTQKGRESRSV